MHGWILVSVFLFLLKVLNLGILANRIATKLFLLQKISFCLFFYLHEFVAANHFLWQSPFLNLSYNHFSHSSIDLNSACDGYLDCEDESDEFDCDSIDHSESYRGDVPRLKKSKKLFFIIQICQKNSFCIYFILILDTMCKNRIDLLYS